MEEEKLFIDYVFKKMNEYNIDVEFVDDNNNIIKEEELKNHDQYKLALSIFDYVENYRLFNGGSADEKLKIEYDFKRILSEILESIEKLKIITDAMKDSEEKQETLFKILNKIKKFNRFYFEYKNENLLSSNIINVNNIDENILKMNSIVNDFN